MGERRERVLDRHTEKFLEIAVVGLGAKRAYHRAACVFEPFRGCSHSKSVVCGGRRIVGGVGGVNVADNCSVPAAGTVPAAGL